MIAILVFSERAYSQKIDKITFGLNSTHFKDWRSPALRFFNPELSYSRIVSNKYGFTYSVNVFYGENFSRETMKKGGIIYRLIFSNDITFDYLFKNFSFSIGPSIRYRNEKKISSIGSFEFHTDPKRGHIDLGGSINSGYHFRITKKSSITSTLTYRLYNKGVNPLSFGMFYSRHF